jgi:hypothetical protein
MFYNVAMSFDQTRTITPEVQRYLNETEDATFALSCFGWMLPFLSDSITETIDAIRDRASLALNDPRNPGKVPVNFSLSDSSRVITFTTENLTSGALSLALEGLTKGLKGSGQEHQTMHLNRLIAGYVIGSEIAENSDQTPWVIDDTVHNLSLPTLTGFFDIPSPSKPNTGSLLQILEYPEQVNHYRFAGAAAKFVLSCSLGNMGALKGDILAISRRLDQRMTRNFREVANSLIIPGLSELTPKPYREPEPGLFIAALNESFSLPAMINAMSHFVVI